MTTTSPSAQSPCPGEPLPVDPFRSLRVRFGMLLGEDDFTTLGAYPRGKTWLHNAWLHRHGVVWGLGVELERDKNEIRVTPGLALDGLGRELYLPVAMCVHAGAWLDAQERPLYPEGATRVQLDLHVAIRFRTCLGRQVPALSEPCEGSGAATTHSRVVEQVEILLRPGLSSQFGRPAFPYHLLRLLFGLEPARVDQDGNLLADDQDVLAARAGLAALPEEDRPAALLALFRRFAARDVVGLAPAQDEDEENTLFPAAEPGELHLADLPGLVLIGGKGAWKIESLPEVVDNEIRSSHVATSTIQELLCAAVCCVAGLGDGSGGPPGPNVVGEVRMGAQAIEFAISAPLAEKSVPGGVSVTHFDPANGWSERPVDKVTFSGGRLVRIELKTPLPAGRLRLLLRGTGPTPILGADGTPFGAEPGSNDGNDFAFMTVRP